MASGGEIDKYALIESFTRIKQDIARISSENAKLSSDILELKQEHKRILEENIELRKNENKKTVSDKIVSEKIDANLIRQIVTETLSKVTPKKSEDKLIRRINKNRKTIIRSRIVQLAEQKKLSVPEIKDMLVDNEGLCSKATFYRYIEKMKEKGQIDLIKVNDSEIVIRLN